MMHCRSLENSKTSSTTRMVDMTKDPVVLTSQEEVDIEFYKLEILTLVDNALALISKRELVSAVEMQNLLLDIRGIVSQVSK